MSSLVSAHTRSTPRSSDPLTVLVIGPSQNGKATFINRIIQLAVNKVPFGKEGDGNFKCTTNCGVYDLAIPLTDYFLRDKATGKEYDVPDITDEEEILKDAWWRKQTAVKYGIEPCRPNAPTVSIRLIDTPGLDDSDNSKEAEKTAMMGGNAQQVRVVDERHKFSILRAMANSGRIHTVCFVLDICSNLGATIQSQHRQALPVQCTQTPCGGK